MTEPIKVLLVGGTWGTGKLINPDGRKSSVIQKMYDAIYELSKKNLIWIASYSTVAIFMS